MKLLTISLCTISLLFFLAAGSLAYNERLCQEQCDRNFDETGARRSCYYGCEMQFSNMSVNRCEVYCIERFDRNSEGDENSANEQVSACMSGCNI